MPLNLANAFLEPVHSRNGKDIGTNSAVALLSHLARMREMVPVDEATYLVAHALSPGTLSMDGVAAEAGYRPLVDRVMEEFV